MGVITVADNSGVVVTYKIKDNTCPITTDSYTYNEMPAAYSGIGLPRVIANEGTLTIHDAHSATVTNDIIKDPNAIYGIDHSKIVDSHMSLRIYPNKTMHLVYGDTKYDISTKDEEIHIEHLYKFMTVSHLTNTFFTQYNNGTIDYDNIRYVRDFMVLDDNHTDALSLTHINPSEHIFLLTGVAKSLSGSDLEFIFESSYDARTILCSYLLPGDIDFAYDAEARVEDVTDIDIAGDTTTTTTDF